MPERPVRRISQEAINEIERAMRSDMNETMWMAIDNERVLSTIEDGANGNYEIYCGIRLIED